MLSCHDVADYFLSLADENAGDLISNLKLQKLVYYAQGFYLAFYGKPLFPEKIHSWEHGPVVKSLYHSYKQYGSSAIPPPNDIDFDKFDPETREFLDEVYEEFGQFSAWKLRNMTHEEPPWQISKGGVIAHRSMKEYFKSFVSDA